MNLGIHEAQRAGYSLAQAAGLGTNVMEGQRPVGPRFPFNSSCISPALQIGGILRFQPYETLSPVTLRPPH